LVRKVLTKQEEKLLQSLKEYDTVALAAQRVNIKPKTAYNILYRLRKKYYLARRLVNTIEPLRGHYDTIALVLTDRRAEVEEKKKPSKEESEENEE
jgi:hypothetical protein